MLLRGFEKRIARNNNLAISLEDLLLEIEQQAQKQDVEQKEKENIEEVLECFSLESQEVHGGNEATGDIPESSNASLEGIQEQNELSQKEEASDSKLENVTSENQPGVVQSESLNEIKTENNSRAEKEQPTEEGKNQANDSKEEEEEEIFEKENGEREENKKQANDYSAFFLESQIKSIGNSLSLLFEKIAEEEEEVIEGDDEWDMQKLLFRTITKTPLKNCRIKRKREKLYIILDTSGSCFKQANLYAAIAKQAAEMGQCYIYNAPNGIVTAYYNPKVKKWENYRGNWWQLENKKIIYFGDFDGGNAVVEASQKNQVYWLSSEDRYEDMLQHSWCSYSLDNFRGVYQYCSQVRDILSISRKIK